MDSRDNTDRVPGIRIIQPAQHTLIYSNIHSNILYNATYSVLRLWFDCFLLFSRDARWVSPPVSASDDLWWFWKLNAGAKCFNLTHCTLFMNVSLSRLILVPFLNVYILQMYAWKIRYWCWPTNTTSMLLSVFIHLPTVSPSSHTKPTWKSLRSRALSAAAFRRFDNTIALLAVQYSSAMKSERLLTACQSPVSSPDRRPYLWEKYLANALLTLHCFHNKVTSSTT